MSGFVLAAWIDGSVFGVIPGVVVGALGAAPSSRSPVGTPADAHLLFAL